MSAGGVVVDVACGSAPLARHLRADRYVGVDRSAAELRLARGRVDDRLLRADAAALPLADGSADTVACVMGLMLVQPLRTVVGEIARVLQPAGRLVAVLPTGMSTGLADALRWAGLLAALRRPGLRWPNPATLDDPGAWLGARFAVRSDERRSFRYPITDAAAARQLVASLYLPGVPAHRIDRAARLAARWQGSDLGLPLRRIVAAPRPYDEHGPRP